ncbi:MAG: hypothetical protein K5849_02455 [Bacteroidales bacterium]|nr:hypothetical protein [Bacteroidales bacterium]
MKRLTILIVSVLACAAAFAQDTTAEEFKGRYERLVRNVGYSGVGVETLLDRWEEAWPEDQAVHVARFNYYFLKSQRTEILPKPGQKRFLGNPPAMTLKDNDGNDIPYFEESFYDDDLFGEAIRVLDRQIAGHPAELRYRYLKVTALLAYEKEHPDMAAAELKQLIEHNASAHPSWTLDGEAVGEDIFQQGIGEYCYQFFHTGSPDSYGYFREISERMNKLYPKNPVFIDNIGSYWQVAEGNDKQAAKFYKKALKIDPDDYAARRNLQIIEKKQAAQKKKK